MQLSLSLLKRIALGVTVVAGSSGCSEQDNSSALSPLENDTNVVSPEITDSSHCINPDKTDSVTTIQPADSSGVLRLTPEYCPPCGMG